MCAMQYCSRKCRGIGTRPCFPLGMPCNILTRRHHLTILVTGSNTLRGWGTYPVHARYTCQCWGDELKVRLMSFPSPTQNFFSTFALHKFQLKLFFCRHGKQAIPFKLFVAHTALIIYSMTKGKKKLKMHW